MRTVDRYIYRQFCIAGTGFLLVLTCAAFLTQTIRIVDMVAFHGKGAVLFAELCLFLGPSILVVSLPMAGFVGTVFVIYRMHGDSEIPALYAAGSGTLRLAWPVCLFALLIAVLTALMALYLSPLGLSKSQERVFLLKNDIGALLLKDGQFLSPSKGVTAFIRQIDKQRVMHDIFVHDKSRREATTTYSAQQAVLEWVDARSQLTMFDGAAYAVGWDGNQVSLLRFDQFVYDLSELSQYKSRFPRPQEMVATELLDSALPVRGEANRRTYIGEGHGQLATPIFAFVLPFLALAGLLAGPARDSLPTSRVVAVTAAGFVLILSFFAAKNLIFASLKWIPVIYAIPLFTLLLAISALHIADSRGARRAAH